MSVNRPLRVTIVTPFGQLGGAERWLLQTLDATDRLEVDLVLLADGPLREEFTRRGLPTMVVPTGRRAADIARSMAAMARHLRRCRPDIVMANGVKAAAVAIPAARLVGVISVWMKHDFSFDTRLARPLGAMADHVIAVSDGVAAAVGRSDVTLLPPARPSWRPRPRAEACRFWVERGMLDDNHLTLAMAGRLIPYKGVDDAIRALALPEANAWDLVVVGEDDRSTPGEGDRLRELAVTLGLGDRVRFAGPVPDTGQWFRGFDAVAVLTRRDQRGFGGEGFSMVALEALCCGVPLIGSEEAPALRRMAQAGGHAVPAGQPAAVAAALARLVDPSARARAGAAGQAWVADHPDAYRCADLLVAKLAEVARRPGAGARGGPPVTVLTCMRNEAGQVDGVVGEVCRQLGPDDEYIVIDDGSSDGTAAEIAAWARRDSRIRMLSGPAINLSAARNLGFTEARHEVVLATDAGCQPASGWLEALRAPYAETSPPSLVTGVFRVSTKNQLEEAFALGCFPEPDEARWPGPLVRVYGALLGRSFSPRRLDGRSMAVTVEAWQAVGRFREDLFSSEDAIFGEAVVRSGRHAVLAVDAEVTWDQHPTLRATARMFYRYGLWGARAASFRLMRRDLLRAAAYLAAPYLLLRGHRGGQGALAAAGAAYLSLPLARCVQGRRGPGVLLALPLALVVKDTAKAAGCLVALCQVAWRSRSRS